MVIDKPNKVRNSRRGLNFPPINRKFSTGSRNFPTANRKFPTASRKFLTGSTKCSTGDMGMKGKAGSSQNNIDDKVYWDSGCSSPKSIGFNEFSSNIATALVCLDTNRTDNFSKMTFDGLVKNVNNKISKFLMYPRFLTICLRMSQFAQITHTHTYVVPFHTIKLFTTLRVNSLSFSGRIVPLFDAILVQQGEGSGIPIEPHYTPSPEAQSPSHTTHSSLKLPPITTTSIPTVTPSDTPIVRQYTRRTRIAQSFVPPTIADEPASPLIDVSQGEACPTDSGFIADQDRATIDKSSTLPYDSAPRVTSHAADEGIDVPTSSGSIPTASTPAEEQVPTGSDVFPTASLVFATATVVTPYRRRKVDAGTISTNLSGSRNPNPTAFTSHPPADQMETLTVETLIPTVSSPVPTTYSTDSQEPSSDARLISKRVANQEEIPSLDNILSLTNRFEDIFEVTSNSDESNGVEADISNMETAITSSPTPTLRMHKDHPKSQTLVDCPKEVRPIRTKWVLKNKKDEKRIVIINKARLVAQRHTQEEGIDYDEVFTPVARIEAIKLFLAYASFMGFTVYQMDVKSAFLYGTIDEEVFVMQPPGFQDPDFLAKVYKVEKSMYGLHQALRAWYGTLSKYLLKNGFQRALMHEKFQMSAMGKLNFFLGLQVPQKEDGIFLSQDKYVGDILKKFRYSDVRSSNTPMDKENPWGKDRTGKDLALHLYRSMIGSLVYLTASRPNIMFAVCACARHQVTPKECYLYVVKRIFRYLKSHPKLGLWYPKESPFDLIDAQVARELEEQLEKKDQRKAEQIAKDVEIARIHAEEELQIMINGLDKNNETIAKYLHEYH
nr:putative ribonuclease H-like domain-containing protein [Tanacetum cinerariifolium]